MARAAVRDGVLRGCPTCGTKVDDVVLRLRDFRWVNESLPGHIGGMDIDFTLTQAKTDRALMLELKPPGVPVSRGARLTFALFVRLGVDCWPVWGPDDNGNVQVGRFDRAGRVQGVEEMTLADLCESISAWWAAGEVAA